MPPKPFFSNNEDLQNKINEYLDKCPDTKTIFINCEQIKVPAYTISGLAYFLGFESRQSFYDYEKNEIFSYTIKRARLFIEKEYEKLLQGPNPTGALFALKNFGWKDKSEIENTNINMTLAQKIKEARERTNKK